MKTAGIIAEYNPFHRGHAYQLAHVKKTLGADYIVIAMSGDYVQRGTSALFPKHLRAEMALRCGADLVLELPVSVSTASAEYFAEGGVRLLDSLGVVDTLCFGSEYGEISGLMSLAQILCKEPEDYQYLLRKALAAGTSFPAARSRALAHYCRRLYPSSSASDNALFSLLPEMDHILETPNNILGIEYCKALIKRKSAIKPVTLRREGAAYHESGLSFDRFASASAIRREVTRLPHTDASLLSAQIPSESRDLFLEAVNRRAFVTEEDFDSILHYCLLSHNEETLSQYLDMSPQLSRRICNHLGAYRGFRDFCGLLKTKELTYTRIQRALLHVMLHILRTPEHIPYARVLGFRRESQALLSEIKKKSSIPLLTKLGDAADILDDDGISLLSETVFASGIYDGILARKSGRKPVHEFQKPLIILEPGFSF